MINEHICSTYSYKMYLFLPSKRVYLSRNSQIPIFLIFSLCLLFGIALLAKFIHLENLLKSGNQTTKWVLEVNNHFWWYPCF